jgi:hypothetical protein
LKEVHLAIFRVVHQQITFGPDLKNLRPWSIWKVKLIAKNKCGIPLFGYFQVPLTELSAYSCLKIKPERDN